MSNKSKEKTPESLPSLPSGYEYIQKIASGGQGSVWLVINKNMQRHEAVKILSPEAREENERFFREVQLLSNLIHTNIVTLYYADPDQHYFIMEYLAGGSFYSYLSQDYSLVEGLKSLCQISKGLHFAHEKGAIHRDLKPKNILFNLSNVPKITDFGLSKIVEDHTSYTGSNTVLGTPQYMPPEQWKNSKRVDHRCDIWAFGIILYEVLTKRHPFPGLSGANLMYAALTEPIPLPKIVFSNLGRWGEKLTNICMKALEKDRDKRYQSADIITEEIEEIIPNISNRKSVMLWIPPDVSESSNKDKTEILTPKTSIIPGAQKEKRQYLGRYKILKEMIRSGNMTRLYHVYHPTLEKKAIVEVFTTNEDPESKNIQFFLKKARMISSFKHPNINIVYDIEKDGNEYFLVMDYIEGTPLDQFFYQFSTKSGKINIRRILKITEHLCYAMDYLNNEGIIHGYISPKDILIDQEKNPIVIDFGLEHYLGTQALSGFEAPEQLRDEREKVDKKTDVYRLGAILYFLLTGKPPYDFGGKREGEKVYLSAKVLSPKKIDNTIPAKIEAICLKAISSQPDDRYSNARDMGQEIKHFLDKYGSMDRPFHKRNPRFITFFAASIGIFLCAFIFLYITFMKNASEDLNNHELKYTNQDFKEDNNQNNKSIKNEINRLSFKALECYNNGQYQEAISYCNKWIEIDPEDGRAYCNIGYIYSSQHSFDKAIEFYNKAIERKMDWATRVSIHNNRGLAYDNLGRFEDALKDYKSAILYNPNSFEAYNNRGLLYYKIKLYTEALADLNKAIEINPSNPNSLTARGNIYLEQNKLQEAMTDANRVIENKPDFYDAYYMRGLIYYKQNNAQLAREDFEKTLSINPNHKYAKDWLRKLSEK